MIDSLWTAAQAIPVSRLDTISLSAIHMALALAVTAHVLLHKRDVGASIGWIGLAWLSPFIGAALYVLLGINRVQRRASRLGGRRRRRDPHQAAAGLAEDDALAPLERTVHRITGRPALGGNGFEMLRCGDDAYPRMLAAIAAAKQSIALSSYILEDDATGRQFIAALAEARGRGAEVRVLIDGVGGGYLRSPAYHALRRAGVPAARFMHAAWPWRMPFLNLRTHKKILVVDGVAGFTGGLNIAAVNVIASDPKDPVRDTHFAVLGPVVGQLMAAFAEDWEFTTREKLAGERWFPKHEAAPKGKHDATARVITSGPDQDVEKIEYIVLQAIGCARKRVRVMTPYFLPDERLITALALAALRGLEVDIVLPERGNHRVLEWATRAQIGPLIEAGCRVWRNPPPFNHSKLLAVDGTWCLLGSANWDMRSFRLNFELNMEVYDSALARQLDREIRTHQGTRLTQEILDARTLPGRLRDAGARLMLPYL
jgi:cardiolipin synthase